MNQDTKKNIQILLAGIATGVLVAISGAFCFRYLITHPQWKEGLKNHLSDILEIKFFSVPLSIEKFDKPIQAQAGKQFGKNNQLTFEMFRNGTFDIDGRSGYAFERSESYRDSAFIRSTQKLPKTYKISIVLGEIDYNLEKIAKLPQDPEYPEGPQNENGCYFIAITDQKPEGHHTNIWWHQHRKLVIDVDNNVWGHGMPNPIFMVYFDRSNRLVAFDGQRDEWLNDWRKAVTYDPSSWYKIEVEKTKTHYILSIATQKGRILKKAKVKLAEVWNEDGFHDEYFVVGDPHENYYQGSMKIKSIAFTPTQ
jgi:hypothetical protein